MSNYQLLLPKMGESVAEATIIKWLKNPGDYIEADEAVLEIATDKVDSEVPSPVAGKLIAQLYVVDEVVQVGVPIALIQTQEQASVNGQQAVSQPVQTAPSQATTPPVTPASQPQAVSQPAAPQPQNIPGIDQLQERKPTPVAERSSSGQSGRFYSPLVKSIASQESISIAELDTIPGTGAEGRLTKDDLLNYLQSRNTKPQQQSAISAAPAQPAPVAQAPVQPAPARQTIPAAQPQVQQTEQPQPVVQQQVIPPAVQQPQPAPVVTQQPAPQVQQQQPPVMPQPEQYIYPQQPQQPAYIPQPQPVYAPQPVYYQAPPVFMPPMYPPQAPQQIYPPQPMYYQAPPAYMQQQPEYAQEPVKPAVSVSGEDEIIEMDRMRRLIADHMVTSKRVAPHVTSFIEVDVTNLVLWRENVKKQFEVRNGEKLTFTPIFIEAVAAAIKEMPMINVSVDGTKIIKRKNINIGMATALPTGNLIVPVIRKADELSLTGLAKAVNDLAGRARKNKLKPEEVKDGTFTITNIGTFSNVMGTPIINQPQVAIMAIGAIKKKPAVLETQTGDVITIRHMMFLSLSYDHRVVDGMLGGSFIKRVADYLEAWDINRAV